MTVLAAQGIAKPSGVPMVGASDVVLHLPVALQVRLAAESLLTGRPADALAAEAIDLYLAARVARPADRPVVEEGDRQN